MRTIRIQIILIAFSTFAWLNFSTVSLAKDLTELTSKEGRAVAWVVRNNPETLLRINVIDLKMTAEYGELEPDMDLDDLNSSYDMVVDREQSLGGGFGVIEENDYCLTMPAVKYIVHSLKSRIVNESGTVIYKESEALANELKQINWYEGYVESDMKRNIVDANAKEYADSYIKLMKSGSKEEYKNYISGMSKEEIKEKYLMKPLCGEAPPVEFMMDLLLDAFLY